MFSTGCQKGKEGSFIHQSQDEKDFLAHNAKVKEGF